MTKLQISQPKSFKDWRTVIGNVAKRHGFQNVSAILLDIGSEGAGVSDAYRAWEAMQNEWEIGQVEGEYGPHDEYWDIAYDFVHDMLIDMNGDLPYYGYKRDFDPGYEDYEDEHDIRSSWSDDDSDDIVPELEKKKSVIHAAKAVATELAGAHLRKTETVIKEAVNQDVMIGRIYIVAGDNEVYSTTLEVYMDISTHNVSIRSWETAATDNMNIRADVDKFGQRMGNFGKTSPHSLLKLIRHEIARDNMLKRSKPTKNFKWYVDGEVIGVGLNVKLAKQAMLAVSNPEKYAKKHTSGDNVEGSEGHVLMSDDVATVTVGTYGVPLMSKQDYWFDVELHDQDYDSRAAVIDLVYDAFQQRGMGRLDVVDIAPNNDARANIDWSGFVNVAL